MPRGPNNEPDRSPSAVGVKKPPRDFAFAVGPYKCTKSHLDGKVMATGEGKELQFASVADAVDFLSGDPDRLERDDGRKVEPIQPKPKKQKAE